MEDRDRWSSRAAFVMASIGSAVGLGNVWRFPYMVYDNGGGAFLIPYFIALMTTGIPLLMVEFNIGIKMQKGPAFALDKIRRGAGFIGWFALLVSFVIVSYYSVVISWVWNYIYYSFTVAWTGHAKEFFFGHVLDVSGSIANTGGIVWPVFAGLLLTWVLIYFIIFKGLGVIGKVVSWTVPLPFILLFVLLIRGITLKGAVTGLNFYLDPDFSVLLNPRVWLAAYGQIFFSLSLGFGVMIAYASYMARHSDISGNAFVTALTNSGISFFAGFVVFSTLGYLAQALGQPVSEVAGSGVGLAFVIFPTAISRLPGGTVIHAIFALIFFVTLINLAINSAFSLVEAIVTGLKDIVSAKRETITFYVCLAGLTAGLIFCTRSGLYWLDIVDHWANNFGAIIVGLMEAVLIGWIYNPEEFRADINKYSDIHVGRWWTVCIKWITPIIIITSVNLSFYSELKSSYGGYPQWAVMTGGWLLIEILFILGIIINLRARNRRKA